MTGEVTLTASLHRPAYQTMTTQQQAYLLLEVTPAPAAITAQQRVNLSLALDRSGSMAGEKLRQLKEAARQVVDHLGPDDMLSIVIFDDQAETIAPAAPVTDQAALKSRIDGIQERGGTHMSTGMQAALHELKRGLSPDYVHRLLLLTDGQTWEDQAQCEALADECRQAGIPIHALGLGVGGDNNWDPRFLESLAQRSGGEWTVVDTPDKVGAVFTSNLQAMQGTAVTNATLTLRYVEGVAPRAVWRVTPLIGRLGHQAIGLRDVQVFLGDVPAGAGQSVLVDLLLPIRQPGDFRLLRADVTYDVPSAALTGQKVTADVVVRFTADAAQAQPLDPRLMNLVERVLAHKLQTQALDEAAAGNLANATRRLRSAATRLLELGEAEMAQQASQQADQMEQSGAIDPAEAQRLRYVTKRLTENVEGDN